MAMSDVIQWQKTNDQYMSTALAWLRLRLLQRVEAPQGEAVTTGGINRQPVPLASLSMPVSDGLDEANLDELRDAMIQLETAEPPPALIILSQRLGFTRFEQEILLLCAGMELDTRIAALCAQVHDRPDRAFPTFALAMVLFDNPAWDALSPERPLRYWRLIE